jgi:hypothetical protein
MYSTILIIISDNEVYQFSILYHSLPHKGRLKENVAPFPSALFSAHILPP